MATTGQSRPNSHTIRPVAPGDIDHLSGLLSRAFHEDPIWTWLQPDADRRPKKLRRIFASMLRNTVRRGDLVLTTDRLEGVAVWRGPGRWRETSGDILRQAPAAVRFGIGPMRRMLVLAREIEPRHPRDHHWYLAVLAADPARQGRGVGSALLGEGIARGARDGLPAFLETETEENVAFYARHGFDVLEEVDIPKGGPHLWLMWRRVAE